MQQPQMPIQQFPLSTPPGSGKAALQYGLIFGAIISLIDIIYSYLVDKGTITWFSGIYQSLERLPLVLGSILSSLVGGSPVFLMLVIACVLAGIFAGIKSKRASSGALAGLLVSGIFLVVDVLIVGVLLTVLLVFPQIPVESDLRGSVLRDAVVYSLGIDLFLLGFCVLLGWLGGALGGGTGAPAQPYMFPPPSPYPPQGFAPASPYPTYGMPM